MRKWMIGLFILGASTSLQADHGYTGYFQQNNSSCAQRGYQEAYYSRPPVFSGGYNAYGNVGQSYYNQNPGYFAPQNSFAEQQMRMNVQNPSNHPGMVPVAPY